MTKDNIMIGDMVHYVREGGIAGNAVEHKCVAALVMGVKPLDKLDLIIFNLTAPTATKINVAKGTFNRGGMWHLKHGDE